MLPEGEQETAAVRHAGFRELFSIPLKNLLPRFVRVARFNRRRQRDEMRRLCVLEPPRRNKASRPGRETREESGSSI